MEDDTALESGIEYGIGSMLNCVLRYGMSASWLLIIPGGNVFIVMTAMILLGSEEYVLIMPRYEAGRSVQARSEKEETRG